MSWEHKKILIVLCIVFVFQLAVAEPSRHVTHWYHIVFTLIFSFSI